MIRYDHRDTGRSTSYPPGRPGYSAREFFDDPRRILDALDVGSVHVVGMSMGGAVAQVLALEHPGRVISLTLVSTTPVIPTGAELPSPEPRVMETFTDPAPEPDWDDRAAVVAYRAETEIPFAGPVRTDDERTLELARQEVERTRGMAASLANHFVLGGQPDLGGLSLGGIAAPSLVVHGSADPMFPVEHGEALAAAIPGARLLVLDAVGHQQPPPE